MRAPQNKHESTDYFARGLYGNSIRQWADPYTAMREYAGPYVIRYKGENGAQGPALFDIDLDCLTSEWDNLLTCGWDSCRLYVNEAIQNDRIIFQGELSTGNWHYPKWYLIGHEGPGIHMREAMMLHDFELKAWRAKEYLRKHMDPSSWDDLMQLLDQWQDVRQETIIELVILDTPVGALAHTGRRVLYWENRLGF